MILFTKHKKRRWTSSPFCFVYFFEPSNAMLAQVCSLAFVRWRTCACLAQVGYTHFLRFRLEPAGAIEFFVFGISPKPFGFNPEPFGIVPTVIGINPKTFGMNPTGLGFNPKANGLNPKMLGFNPPRIGLNNKTKKSKKKWTALSCAVKKLAVLCI